MTTRSLQRASGFVWTCLAMKHERGRRISRWISCGISCRISCRISWSAGHGWCVWSAGSHFKYRWLVTLELHVYGTAHLFLSMCHLTILLRGPHSLLTNYCLDEFFFISFAVFHCRDKVATGHSEGRSTGNVRVKW